MVDKLPNMTLKTVGRVKSEVKEAPGPDYDWRDNVSEIVIDKTWTDALDSLEGFSHIIVLYWMHQNATDKLSTKIHPMGKPEIPLVGLFATRSPYRPNPVGKTTVRLLQRQKNILKVKGLDAIDGTPVIDIKPYIPGYDSAADAKAPPWITNR